MRIAGAIFAIAALAPLAAPAAKLDEGISTGLTRRGSLNRVDKAHTDDAIYYWIKVDENPGATSTTRCVVTGGRMGTTILDETEKVDASEGEGYLFCGVDGDEEELEAGRYTFAIYLNQDKIGEKSLEVEKRSFWSTLTTRKKYKYMMGALGLAVIAYYWVRKKLYGDKKFDEVFRRKEDAAVSNAAASAGVGGVTIGSKVNGAAGAAAMPGKPPPAAPPPPTPDDLFRGFKAKLAADPQFRIATAEEVLPIAKAARAAGDAKTAVAAVRGFDKAFPGHSLIPDVFVFTAKVLAEDFKNFDMARKILEHIVSKYPGHHLAQEARNLLKAMPQTA